MRPPLFSYFIQLGNQLLINDESDKTDDNPFYDVERNDPGSDDDPQILYDISLIDYHTVERQEDKIIQHRQHDGQ